MRTWQHIGFKHVEGLFPKKVIGEEKVERRIKQPDGTYDIVLGGQNGYGEWRPVYGPAYKTENLGIDDVWYGEGPMLQRYIFDDGRIWVSYVQECPWSSGPMTFLAFKDEKTGEPIPETLWTTEELSKY